MEELMPKFEVGQIVITPAASAALKSIGYTAEDLLVRHQSGDWGDVSQHDRHVNEQGLAEQFNLQSVYAVHDDPRLVVCTNRDRTVTTMHVNRQGV